MSNPLISICVPAYKKPEFVVRLLDAVLRQSYKQVEVILSDDSPDDGVKIAIEPYKTELRIQYYQNTPALGSPKNWNRAIEKATGLKYNTLKPILAPQSSITGWSVTA